MNRALILALLLAAACARNGQPPYQPMPEAKRAEIELDPQEATKKLAEAMTGAGLPVTSVATREGFVETAWFDSATMKPAGGRPLGTKEVRVRAWVMPYRYGWSEITMEAVYRPIADPSLPPRELERSVPFGHPARVKVREILQQLGATSTLAETDAPAPELKRPIMDPGRLDSTGHKVVLHPDSAGADSGRVRKDSVPLQKFDSARVFHQQSPTDTLRLRPRADTARPVSRPDTTVPAVKPAPVPAPAAPPPAALSGYAVQVAAAPDSARADEFVRRLRSAGYSPRVVFEEDRYKVRTELFASRTDAMIALEKLRGMFGDAFVVRE